MSRSTHDVVLVVDDEPDVRAYLGRILRRDLPGIEVLFATDGKDALSVLAQRSVDLVLTDQRMPEMTGVELLGHIAARMPDVPRILLTGFADMAVATLAVNEGHVHAFYQKPVDARALTTHVQKLLDEHRARSLRSTAFSRAGDLKERAKPFVGDLREERP